jgi:hypothetical protein
LGRKQDQKRRTRDPEEGGPRRAKEEEGGSAKKNEGGHTFRCPAEPLFGLRGRQDSKKPGSAGELLHDADDGWPVLFELPEPL